MYKLTVVAGPNRGATYAVQEGENSIGRQAGSHVTLSSAKVSKRHCVLVVSDGEVVVQDQGSSNGTFVNGVLAKSKALKPGDRISVGEYVLELSQPPARSASSAPAVVGMGNVVRLPVQRQASVPQAFPGAGGGIGADAFGGGMAAGIPGGIQGASSVASPSSQMPKDLKGRLLWFFDYNVMPFFYGLNLRHEWRVLCAAALGAFAVGNLLLSVYPLLEQNRAGLVRESGKRAQLIARQIAERNTPYLAARAETKTEIGSFESAEGVRVAVLTDLDSRILAPSSRINQYLQAGPEALLAVKARDAFRAGRETGLVRELDDSTICAIEPVRVASQAAGRNVTVAMAVVSIDTSMATPDIGETGMIYSQAFILTALLGGLLMVILYKITLKPLLTLNEDMDKALKGESQQVTHEFKFEELDPLWDIINSALQRVSQASPQGGLAGGFGGAPGADDLLGPVRMLGAAVRFGVVACDSDRKILYLNPAFEDLSGIRADAAVGQEFAAVARDQSLAMFTDDLMSRASGDGVSEDYDFSGITHKVHVAAFGSPARCYLLLAVKVEG